MAIKEYKLVQMPAFHLGLVSFSLNLFYISIELVKYHICNRQVHI